MPKLPSPLSPRLLASLEGYRPIRGRSRLQIFVFTIIAIVVSSAILFHWHNPYLVDSLYPTGTDAGSAEEVGALIKSLGRPFYPALAAWSSEEHEDNKPLWRIGQNTALVNVTTPIIDIRSGLPIDEETDGGPFNLAVLKLPRGSKWDFVGIARGPTRTREFMKVEGHNSREQSLIGLGLNVGSNGDLTVVSDVYMFDYQLIPKPGCIKTGPWVATYGPEDARLFWTDAGTPAMTFARNSELTNICRGLGLVPDLRSWFPALADAMVPSKEQGVVEYDGYRRPGEPAALELIRHDRGPSMVEKNWAAFYPGPEPTGQMVPFMSYHIAPYFAMKHFRNDSDIRRLWYEPVEWPVRTTPLSTEEMNMEKALRGEEGAKEYAESVRVSAAHEQAVMENALKCLQHAHKHQNPGAMHQASPIYRLTLCDRGCRATAANTVNFAVFHVKTNQKDFHNARRYIKFFATFNTTAPYAPISVGPGFSVDGLELRDINFALSLAPLEEHDLNPSVPPKRTPRPYLPSHFFADDKIMISFGVRDEEMATTVLTMGEALGGHQMCADVTA